MKRADFGRGGALVFGDIGAARDRLAASDRMVQMRLSESTPPEAMRAAPVAPARGAMQLVPNYEVTPRGFRRETGAHWRDACRLVVMNAKAAARAEQRGADVVLPFTDGQIWAAAMYRAVVEWRAGSGCKMSSLEAGRGGSGSGVFIDTFMDQGVMLDRFVKAIGDGVALRPRRGMDTDNVRRVVTDRALVDAVVLSGRDLAAVLRAHKWPKSGANVKALRVALSAALNRMQGYRDDGPQDMA